MSTYIPGVIFGVAAFVIIIIVVSGIIRSQRARRQQNGTQPTGNPLLNGNNNNNNNNGDGNTVMTFGGNQGAENPTLYTTTAGQSGPNTYGSPPPPMAQPYPYMPNNNNYMNDENGRPPVLYGQPSAYHPNPENVSDPMNAIQPLGVTGSPVPAQGYGVWPPGGATGEGNTAGGYYARSNNEASPQSDK